MLQGIELRLDSSLLSSFSNLGSNALCFPFLCVFVGDRAGYPFGSFFERIPMVDKTLIPFTCFNRSFYALIKPFKRCFWSEAYFSPVRCQKGFESGVVPVLYFLLRNVFKPKFSLRVGYQSFVRETMKPPRGQFLVPAKAARHVYQVLVTPI